MITTKFRPLATAMVAFAVALPAALGMTSSATAAPRDDDSSSMEHVVKHQSPRNKQIQPYVNEHKKRYTSESTHMTSVPPCRVLPPNRADWPSGVTACEGDRPAPTKQSVPQPQAGTPAAPPAGGGSGGTGSGGGRSSGGGSGGGARSAPSCR